MEITKQELVTIIIMLIATFTLFLATHQPL